MIFTPYQEFLALHLLPVLAVCMALMAQLGYVNHAAAYFGVLLMAIAQCCLSVPVKSHQLISDSSVREDYYDY